MAPRWIVLRERRNLRWGGDLRRHYVLSALGARPDAADVDGCSLAVVQDQVRRLDRWTLRRPRLAAATMLTSEAVEIARSRTRLAAVDIHDDPIAQMRTLGVEPDPGWLEETERRKADNVAAFDRLIVPSAELAELAGLPPDRIVVAGNGTDPSIIRPEAFPAEPAIGMMSGAAAGRGIETLIEAARRVRATAGDVRLILWLAATGPASQAWLDDLRAGIAGEPWIEIASAPYAELGRQLARATVQVVPNPAAPYWDAVSPIKLFDAMASGRPVVVTPRTVMRRTVEDAGAGLVTAGDAPDDLAEALLRVIGDAALAARLGAAGRVAAETTHAWGRIARDVAATLAG